MSLFNLKKILALPKSMGIVTFSLHLVVLGPPTALTHCFDLSVNLRQMEMISHNENIRMSTKNKVVI